MEKVFVMYVPGSQLSEFHKRSPWIMIPTSFKDIGYHSVLICGQCSIGLVEGIEVYETIKRQKSILRSLFEPFLAFKKIITLKPDILVISPIGSYLIVAIPLFFVYKKYISLTKLNKPKFILKTDWSLDFTGIGYIKRILLKLLLIISSYTFDRISFETYCGTNKAKIIPLIKAKTLIRIPIGYPQNINFESFNIDSKDKNRVLCVARIAEMKGQIYLLKSFIELSKKYSQWTLRFVGPVEDTNYKNKLDAIILKNKIMDRVSFTDFVKENILVEELKQASIFCLPSIHTESAGQVKYEAAAAGLPVLTTDVPCREDNEELGFLVVHARNVGELVKNLGLLMDNYDFRRLTAEYTKKKLLSYRDIAGLIRDL
jgi:glycosyltransferase involved in cell wall biosynthesis